MNNFPDDTFIAIACRIDSKRLPGKATKHLVGKISPIQILISRLKKIIPSSQIILTTTKEKNCDILMEVAEKNNINCFRGSKLDVMDRFINAGKKYGNFSDIVRVTGDNPLTDPNIIVEMIKFHKKNFSDYTFTQSIPVGTRPEIINFDFLKNLHKKIKNSSNTEYMTFYLRQELGQKISEYKKDFIRIFDNETLTLDTIEDFNYLKKVFDNSSSNIYTELADIIKIINTKKLKKEKTKITSSVINLDEFEILK